MQSIREVLGRVHIRHNSVKFALVTVFLLLISLGSIFIGPVHLSFKSVIDVIIYQIFGKFSGISEPNHVDYVIVAFLREPEIIAAIVVGAALGVGGSVVQSIFRNPIAEPYIIGVSSGAALGAVLSIGYGLVIFGFYSTQIFAFVFSLIVVFLVYVMSMRRGKVPITYFLLIGISLSLFISGIVAYVLITDTRLAGESEILSWLLGSLQSITWNELAVVTLIIVFTSFFSALYAGELDLIQMGEEYAGAAGVRVERTKRMSIIISTLGVSAAVSISGLIGFVGLIMPHIARLIFGGSNKVVIPASALLGSVFLLLSDDLSRVILSQQVVPVGIITSFVGVPVFMYLLRRLSYGYYES